jgi:hypothetical protein
MLQTNFQQKASLEKGGLVRCTRYHMFFTLVCSHIWPFPKQNKTRMLIIFYVRFLAKPEAGEAGHVACFFRPSDRLRGWSGSTECRSFYQKVRLFSKIGHAVHSFFFTDVPLIFLGNLLGIHNFTKRTLQFSMIDLKA